MSQSRRRNTPVVPQAAKMLEQLKYEVAQELGIEVPKDGYWGPMHTRDVGLIGGTMTRRLVQLAQKQLSGQNPSSLMK